MSTKRRRGLARHFEAFSAAASRFAGSVAVFSGALGVVLIWGLTGPLFGFSDTWQLVINTGTTVITFLMVFLIQQTQNKDGLAIQLKLNELVAALHGASNRLISVEHLTGEELDVLEAHYQRLAEMARSEADIRTSHSIEEAEDRHRRKARALRAVKGGAPSDEPGGQGEGETEPQGAVVRKRGPRKG